MYIYIYIYIHVHHVCGIQETGPKCLALHFRYVDTALDSVCNCDCIYVCVCFFVCVYVCVGSAFDCISGMGWLRLVGSFKLWVSFAEYRLFYRVFLQKRPMILRSLLIVATLYVESAVIVYVIVTVTVSASTSACGFVSLCVYMSDV